MDSKSLQAYIEKSWDDSVIPEMMDYIKIPAKSPFFDSEWEKNGYLLQAARQVEEWCKGRNLNGLTTEVINPPGKTPLLLLEIEATDPDNSGTVLLYGHLDKQPETVGWDEDKGPFKPVIENDRLYGRGGADDAYSVFSAVTAIEALQNQSVPHGRCVILIETCEESGSLDLPYYLDTYKEKIGSPDLIVCLDSGCGNYDTLWLTTSLRGTVVGNLHVEILKEGIHSGNSGIVASSFRIIRQLLDRVENAETGEVTISELNVAIPPERLAQIRDTAKILGSEVAESCPLVNGARAVSGDPETLIKNSTWRPTLSYIAADGIPAPGSAGSVLRPGTTLQISFRLPPTVDPETASAKIKEVFEADPPYGAKVSFEAEKGGPGWNMPELTGWLGKAMDEASENCFGRKPAFSGEGGSIPLMNLLAGKFPGAEFVVTGVLGPNSNAHGPNEFLHIPFVKKLTGCVAHILAAHGAKQG